MFVGYRDILKVLSCCAFRLFLELSLIGVKLSINSFHYLAQLMLNRPVMYVQLLQYERLTHTTRTLSHKM